MNRGVLLMGMLVLWLGGCSLAPEFMKPETAVPQG